MNQFGHGRDQRCHDANIADGRIDQCDPQPARITYVDHALPDVSQDAPHASSFGPLFCWNPLRGRDAFNWSSVNARLLHLERLVPMPLRDADRTEESDP